MTENVINTKESVYEPITIIIDGQTFEARKMNRAAIKKINEMANKSDTEPEILYDWVIFVFDGDKKFQNLVNDLDLRDIKTIVGQVRNQLAFPKLKKAEAEESENKKKQPDKTTIKGKKKS